MKLKKKERFLLHSLLIETFFIILLLAIYLFEVPFLHNTLKKMENALYDFRIRQSVKEPVTSRDVTIIALDESSISYIDKSKGIKWPFPRSMYRPVLLFLKKAGAKAVVFDIDFFNEFEKDEEDGDQIFAETLREVDNVILTCKTARLTSESENLPSENELKNKFNLKILKKNGENQGENYLQLPIPLFFNAAKGSGFGNIALEEDGIFRKYSLYKKYKSLFIPSLALKTWLLINKKNTLEINGDGNAIFLGKELQLDKKNNFYLKWMGKGYHNFVYGEKASFVYHSFGNVLDAGIQLITGQKVTKAEFSHFRDKIVLLGGTAANLYDFRSTPLSNNNQPDPGVEIHATAIDNLIKANFGNYVASIYIVFITLFLCFLLYLLIIKTDSMVQNAIYLILMLLGSVLFFNLCYIKYNYYFDTVPLLLGLIISYFVPVSYKYLAERDLKQDIKKMFDHYLDPTIIEKLIDNPDELKMGGDKKEVTLFFSDIEGFTTLSEKLIPEKLLQILNEYLSIPTEIVMKQKGYVDKYIGDAIMAIFGAPIKDNNHAKNACQSALEIQGFLKQREFAIGEQKSIKLNTRIGLHSGPAIIGNIGSDLTKSKKYNYTAIGDTVNLASRLEGFNKNFLTNIAVSETTKIAAGNGFLFRKLDLVAVKGKDEPINVFELITWREKAYPELFDFVENFEIGITEYQKDRRNFLGAIDCFKKCLRLFPNDFPSKLYIERCNHFILNPPLNDWDGVYRLKTK